ncbi:MAG: hypothetical protein IJC26_00550 [Clostridia bacterium]|nr:hypothetical protein [Clostridia bacterium]
MAATYFLSRKKVSKESFPQKKQRKLSAQSHIEKKVPISAPFFREVCPFGGSDVFPPKKERKSFLRRQELCADREVWECGVCYFIIHFFV